MNEEMSLQALINTLAEERGLDLRGYKHSTLERRVRKRMFQTGAPSYADYLNKIRENPAREITELLNTVLINVTEFFRDPQAWDALRNDVLPQLLAQLKPGDSFRAWSAGCASGEEAYSIAILLTDLLGDRLPEYDVKVYGTDIDEDALTTARRGLYPATALRRVRPDWREKFFTGTSTMRINPEVRRLVIFGRSNLVSDAPISHCNLVSCRNVLIYFDLDAQKQIFSRLHYALNPHGVLFLGKAESKLSESSLFKPITSRWRIFQKIDKNPPRRIPDEGLETVSNNDQDNALQQQLQAMQQQYRSLLQTIKSGVLTLDSHDIITACNESAQAVWGLPGVPLVGKRLQNTDLVYRCPELAGRLEASKAAGEQPITFQCRIRNNEDERTLAVTLRPVIAERSGNRTGTIINAEDTTTHERLQSTVEQLEATSEELQSANEELETTNEELQSTNEELETTNEELQSTNEELETTNEELQSLNEELENLNEELESRTRELHTLTNRYAETLKRMPWPVMLVDKDEKIQLWNGAAQKIFGIGATSVVGIDLDRMPLEQTLRKTLVRRCRAVMQQKKPSTIRNQSYESSETAGSFDVRFTPISREENEIDGVMIMFGPTQAAGVNGPAPAKPNDKKGSNPGKAAKSKRATRSRR